MTELEYELADEMAVFEQDIRAGHWVDAHWDVLRTDMLATSVLGGALISLLVGLCCAMQPLVRRVWQGLGWQQAGWGGDIVAHTPLPTQPTAAAAAHGAQNGADEDEPDEGDEGYEGNARVYLSISPSVSPVGYRKSAGRVVGTRLAHTQQEKASLLGSYALRSDDVDDTAAAAATLPIKAIPSLQAAPRRPHPGKAPPPVSASAPAGAAVESEEITAEPAAVGPDGEAADLVPAVSLPPPAARRPTPPLQSAAPAVPARLLPAACNLRSPCMSMREDGSARGAIVAAPPGISDRHEREREARMHRSANLETPTQWHPSLSAAVPPSATVPLAAAPSAVAPPAAAPPPAAPPPATPPAALPPSTAPPPDAPPPAAPSATPPAALQSAGLPDPLLVAAPSSTELPPARPLPRIAAAPAMTQPSAATSVPTASALVELLGTLAPPQAARESRQPSHDPQCNPTAPLAPTTATTATGATLGPPAAAHTATLRLAAAPPASDAGSTPASVAAPVPAPSPSPLLVLPRATPPAPPPAPAPALPPPAPEAAEEAVLEEEEEEGEESVVFLSLSPCATRAPSASAYRAPFASAAVPPQTRHTELSNISLHSDAGECFRPYLAPVEDGAGAPQSTVDCKVFPTAQVPSCAGVPLLHLSTWRHSRQAGAHTPSSAGSREFASSASKRAWQRQQRSRQRSWRLHLNSTAEEATTPAIDDSPSTNELSISMASMSEANRGQNASPGDMASSPGEETPPAVAPFRC